MKPTPWIHKSLVLTVVVCALTQNALHASDWMTWPSTYTHDPVEGQPIDQYALPVEPRAQVRTDFQRSGMRHYRSSLQAGQTSDNIHIVEQWGQQVVPYEQWRFPYRPFGVPYDQWGPQAPYGIFNSQIRGNFQGYPYPVQPGPVFPGGPGLPGAQPPQNSGPLPGVGQVPPGGYPGTGYPGNGYVGPGYRQPIRRAPAYGNNGLHPGYGYPGQGGYYPQPGFVPPSAGFPLTPSYQGQPWFDGNYPEAPPLRSR